MWPIVAVLLLCRCKVLGWMATPRQSYRCMCSAMDCSTDDRDRMRSPNARNIAHQCAQLKRSAKYCRALSQKEVPGGLHCEAKLAAASSIDKQASKASRVRTGVLIAAKLGSAQVNVALPEQAQAMQEMQRMWLIDAALEADGCCWTWSGAEAQNLHTGSSPKLFSVSHSPSACTQRSMPTGAIRTL